MKTSHYPSFLLLFLLLSSCSASDTRSASYNHLQLVYIWPNTFCLDRNVACKIPVAQDFVLHGLWPADRAGNALVYCSKTGSISWALRKYERNLAASWPSLRMDLTNERFWQYQWDKHGTCALQKMNVLHYLQLIIAQKGEFNLLRALSTNNIRANGSSYPRLIVEAAIRQETEGKNFYMSCQKFRNGAFIKDIYICLDGTGHRVISCPHSNKPRGCGRNMNLIFPAAATRIRHQTLET